MLMPRIVTAVLLLGLLAATLASANPVPFAALALTLAAAGAWEWGRMLGAAPTMAVVQGAAVVVFGGFCAARGWMPPALPTWFWVAVALVWLALLTGALRLGVARWKQVPKLGGAEMGVVLMALTWLAVLAARERGIAFLLSVCCIVWVCDTAAYATGRLLGRTKLAPTISPGKTREGVAGGVAAAVALALVWWTLAPAGQGNVFALLGASWGVAGVVVGVVLLALLGVAGDLFESLVKRAAGVKDSGGLLPGHGGVLDRMDALLPVLPAALALVTLGGRGGV